MRIYKFYVFVSHNRSDEVQVCDGGSVGLNYKVGT